MTAYPEMKRQPSILLPSRFEVLKPVYGDSPVSSRYEYISRNARCFLLVSPVRRNESMPFRNPQTVIDGIHRALAENQGLIEVRGGFTRHNRRYIFSVVKTLKRKLGIQYTLNLYIEQNDAVFQVQGFFCESSGTDARDARVFALLEKQGKIRITKNGIEGWVSDPYDAFFTHGIRMNLSEAPQFDILFPAHPLSELRRFVKEVTTEN